jgi:cytochrome c553
MSNYEFRLIVVVATIVVATGIAFVVKAQLIPDSFGKYGHYRADAIDEETQRPIRHGTNTSCLKCHAYEAAIHLKGRHKTISCEFCHGTYADHINNGKKIGALPVKKDTEITTLCLRCHNTEIKARSQAVIKTVAMPEHLESQKVKVTHTCNQCHHVHAPLKYINRAKQITGLMEAES